MAVPKTLNPEKLKDLSRLKIYFISLWVQCSINKKILNKKQLIKKNYRLEKSLFLRNCPQVFISLWQEVSQLFSWKEYWLQKSTRSTMFGHHHNYLRVETSKNQKTKSNMLKLQDTDWYFGHQFRDNCCLWTIFKWHATNRKMNHRNRSLAIFCITDLKKRTRNIWRKSTTKPFKAMNLKET